MVLLEDCTYKNTDVYVPNITRGKVVKCYDGDTVTIATIIDNKGFYSDKKNQHIKISIKFKISVIIQIIFESYIQQK